jgi:hypothetical protein
VAALTTLARVTVVVPVGPGDALVPRLREQLRDLPLQVHEVRAADPATGAVGVQDGPRPHWRIGHAPAGRALQQNAGARDAAGDWLWFLHADCVLAPTTAPALAAFIERADAHPGAAPPAGYFDLSFLDDGPRWTRLNAGGAWLRSHWLGLPFGDQGLVIPRRSFERLGGFDRGLARGEDHDLVWRLRRAGVPLRPVGAPLLTSARKYARQGWCTTTAGHLGETVRQAWRFSRNAARGRPAR